jgi:hypothetical protein
VDPIIIDFETPATWPAELRAVLDADHELFLGWTEGGSTRISAQSYDQAIYRLMDALQPYALIGWHCARLTEQEIATIISRGMGLPDAAMLSRRIDAVVTAGLLSSGVGDKFKAKNQADEPFRAGRIWFCFFPPYRAGESGIRDLVGFWGGEALYNSHDRDPETSAALRSIGTPAIVEAVVPIALLRPGAGLAFKVVRRYLIGRGYRTSEPCDHEDPIVQPLPARFIRRVIKFPEPDFLQLTACESSSKPLAD